MASIKVFDPVSVPLSVLEELQQLRAQARATPPGERTPSPGERTPPTRTRRRPAPTSTRPQRQSKRQAAPFSKGPPKPQPKTPGRKSGAAHGRHGHRLPPSPAAVDEVLEAPLPDACPQCGGSVRETEVATQYQTEIPRRPLIRQFNVHVGCCCGCGRRVQGRHPLQTSDALGAAASQIGPDAQAAVVLLNKTFGLSHGKVAAVFQALFGITLTRGASAQIVLRAADRLEPAHQEIRQEIKASPCLTPDETGWRVAGQPAWLHAWVAERATCYAIDPHRKADVLERLIGIDWSGKMVHDGFVVVRPVRARRPTSSAWATCCDGCGELEAKATRGAVHYPRQADRVVHRGDPPAQPAPEGRGVGRAVAAARARSSTGGCGTWPGRRGRCRPTRRCRRTCGSTWTSGSRS